MPAIVQDARRRRCACSATWTAPRSSATLADRPRHLLQPLEASGCGARARPAATGCAGRDRADCDGDALLVTVDAGRADLPSRHATLLRRGAAPFFPRRARSDRRTRAQGPTGGELHRAAARPRASSASRRRSARKASRPRSPRCAGDADELVGEAADLAFHLDRPAQGERARRGATSSPSSNAVTRPEARPPRCKARGWPRRRSARRPNPRRRPSRRYARRRRARPRPARRGRGGSSLFSIDEIDAAGRDPRIGQRVEAVAGDQRAPRTRSNAAARRLRTDRVGGRQARLAERRAAAGRHRRAIEQGRPPLAISRSSSAGKSIIPATWRPSSITPTSTAQLDRPQISARVPSTGSRLHTRAAP